MPGHSSWRSDRAQAGGGALLEHSIHAADIVCWLFGPAVRVSARTRAVFGFEVEDVAASMIEHASGVVGTILSVFNGVRGREERRFEVFFEGAAVEATTDFIVGAAEDSFLVQRPDTEPERPDLDAMREQHFAALGLPRRDFVFYTYPADRHWVRCVQDGEPASPGFDDALRAHELVDAAYRSASHRSRRLDRVRAEARARPERHDAGMTDLPPEPAPTASRPGIADHCVGALEMGRARGQPAGCDLRDDRRGSRAGGGEHPPRDLSRHHRSHAAHPRPCTGSPTPTPPWSATGSRPERPCPRTTVACLAARRRPSSKEQPSPSPSWRVLWAAGVSLQTGVTAAPVEQRAGSGRVRDHRHACGAGSPGLQRLMQIVLGALLGAGVLLVRVVLH